MIGFEKKDVAKSRQNSSFNESSYTCSWYNFFKGFIRLLHDFELQWTTISQLDKLLDSSYSRLLRPENNNNRCGNKHKMLEGDILSN